jgi:hypothetical protein
MMAQQQTKCHGGAVDRRVVDPSQQLDGLAENALPIIELCPGKGEHAAGAQQMPTGVRAVGALGAPLQPGSLARDRRQAPGVPMRINAPQPPPHLQVGASRRGADGKHLVSQLAQLADVVWTTSDQLASDQRGIEAERAGQVADAKPLAED